MDTPQKKPDAGLDPGHAFGKYVLLKRLAVGGMAEVYLANMSGAAGFNKLVVIKQVLPHLSNEPKFIHMFLDEGRLAAQLSHPNIAQTFDFGEENGRHYMAMEYVAGESLSSIVRRAQELDRPFPLACGLRIILDLLEALDYAHGVTDRDGNSLKIVHRDITPSNLMVTFHGGVKLLDFGIARATGQNHLTRPGMVKGKVGFMAPEQVRARELDNRTDLFAAGALLYILATGRHPYQETFDSRDPTAPYLAMAEARFPRPRQLVPTLHPELERIILKAMTRSPEERYSVAAQIITDLERFATTAGLYPSRRDLADFMRALYPEKASFFSGHTQLDPASLDDWINVTGVDIVTDTSGEQPAVSLSTDETRIERRPARDPNASRGADAAVAGRRSTRDADAPTLPPFGPRRVERDQGEPSDEFDQEPTGKPQPRSHTARSDELEPKRLGRRGRPLAIAAAAVLVVGAFAFFALPEPAAIVPTRSRPEPEPRTERTSALTPAVADAGAVFVAAGADVQDVAAVAQQRPKQVEAAERDARPKPVIVPAKTPTKRDKPPAPAPAAAPRGFVTIDTYPWSNVWLGGRNLGMTPIMNLELAAGQHSLVLENSQLRLRRQVSVRVKAGETVKVYHRLTGD